MPFLTKYIFLRTLAGAYYLDMMMTFGISRAKVYAFIHDVCSVVLSGLSPPGLPRTTKECRETARKFA